MFKDAITRLYNIPLVMDEIIMSKDHSWNGTDTDKTESFEQQASSLPFCSPQVMRQMAWHRTRPSEVTGTT